MRDEKYTGEKVSDFEYFDEWERILPYAAGHSEIIRYKKELKDLGLPPVDVLGYSRERSIDRWICGNRNRFVGTFEDEREKKYTAPDLKKREEKREYLSFDVEKNVSYFTKECQDFRQLTEKLSDAVKKAKDQYVSLNIKLNCSEYKRPDPYSAERIYMNKNCDEFLNSIDSNIFYSQLLVELIIGLKRNKNIAVTISGGGSVLSGGELARYLHRRHIFSGPIGIFVTSERDVAYLSKLACEIYPEIYIRPVIDCRAVDITKESYIDIFEKYPIGAFIFKNGNECSALCSAIDHISDSREHAELLMRATFSK